MNRMAPNSQECNEWLRAYLPFRKSFSRERGRHEAERTPYSQDGSEHREEGWMRPDQRIASFHHVFNAEVKFGIYTRTS